MAQMAHDPTSHHPLRRSAVGLCLTELLCALTIGMAVATLAFDAVSHLEGRFRSQHRNMALEQDTRLGLSVLEHEIRMALNDVRSPGPAIQTAAPSMVEFVANVNGFETSVASTALAGQQEITVQNGSEWPEGKGIRLCHKTRCLENRLARDGQRETLTLMWPLQETIPVGTEVFTVNQVRYYVGEGPQHTFKLMRQIDGGATSLIGDLHAVGFRFRTRTGLPTGDPRQIATVRVELTVGTDRRKVSQEIALRR